MTTTKATVTRSGQVSLPAEIRHRWAAGRVLIIDRGNYAIVRPVPADIVAALNGAHAGPGPGLEQTRVAERESADEQERLRLAR